MAVNQCRVCNNECPWQLVLAEQRGTAVHTGCGFQWSSRGLEHRGISLVQVRGLQP